MRAGSQPSSNQDESVALWARTLSVVVTDGRIRQLNCRSLSCPLLRALPVVPPYRPRAARLFLRTKPCLMIALGTLQTPFFFTHQTSYFFNTNTNFYAANIFLNSTNKK